MFGPFEDIWNWVRPLVPSTWKFWKVGKPHFNFLTVHYLYMIGLTILGSILLYPPQPKLLAYIDALFFAAGSATQSGLNTVNINDLYTYQQVVMMMIACVGNPIFINTFVVFIRLYWFEKRFQHIVKDARESRRTRTRSRSKSEVTEDLDPSRVEMGVGNRQIKVLHNTVKPNGVSGGNADMREEEKKFGEKLGLGHLAESVSPSPPGGSRGSGESSQSARKGADDVAERQSPNAMEDQPEFLGQHPTFRREITFADEVASPGNAQHKRHVSDLERVPEQKDASQHIAFLEKQRKSKEQGALRIPGPRDFDRGDVPTQVEDDEGTEEGEMRRPWTRNTTDTVPNEKERRRSSDEGSEQLNEDDHPVKRGITIDEPDHPKREDGAMPRSATATSTGLNVIGKVLSSMKHRRDNSQGPSLRQQRTFRDTFSSLTTARTKEQELGSMPYLSWQATIGRNSAFMDLTAQQREELGGIEYRSLKTLAIILICYFVGFHVLGMVVLLPWITVNKSHYCGSVIEGEDGQSCSWWGVFTSASMFNDLGFTLTPDSMESFATSTLPLLFGSFLIIIGNTGFPVMLRFVIWVLSKFVPVGSGIWEELKFLLDHPRRCFTLLFPSKATWWLFWVLVLLNGIDLIFFIILDLNDPVVTTLSPGYRVLNGWFQATSTRTAGFACVNLAALHPAIQVSYMIMMYISVFPIAISVRRTNVYEEKSLGVWGGEEEGGPGEETSYVGTHLRRQLSFDLWYIFLGFFIIAVVEGDRLSNTNEYAFTMFSVLFEIVSAYGTVGLSLGYPNIDESFSAEFAVISKLVIIAMMLRGRHRGLPYALDRAILLPSEKLNEKEAEDGQRIAGGRRASIVAADRPGFWEANTVLDASGLPIQHTGAHAAGDAPVGLTAKQRRGSTMTNASGRGRERSFAQVFAGALSAGPTYSKND